MWAGRKSGRESLGLQQILLVLGCIVHVKPVLEGFSTGEAAGTFGTFDSGEDPGLGEVLPEAENTEIFV